MPDKLPLILAPEHLREIINTPDLALIEVSSSVEARHKKSGALPGSRVVFWKDLAWDELRRELATGPEFSARLFDLGAGEDTRIVLYGEPTQFASYVIWGLHVRGYRNISYLDGGLEAWLAAKYPLAADLDVARTPATLPLVVPAAGSDSASARVGRDDVLASLDDPRTLRLDFRTTEEYSGERVSGPGAPLDHGAERHGRIPGAKHFFFRDLLDGHGRFQSADDIRNAARERGALDADRIINYCRLSHRASLGWLALTELVGLQNVRVYDGSWTEWGSIVGVPIEK